MMVKSLISASAWEGFSHCLPASSYIDGLVQERRNSSALAMELRLSCTEPSTCNVNRNKPGLALLETITYLQHSHLKIYFLSFYRIQSFSSCMPGMIHVTFADMFSGISHLSLFRNDLYYIMITSWITLL